MFGGPEFDITLSDEPQHRVCTEKARASVAFFVAVV